MTSHHLVPVANAHLWRPHDASFDRVVVEIAGRLLPNGFDVAEDAPTSLEQLVERMNRTGRMCVWSGASEYTIYGSPRVNFAFRAWHDWCHWRGRFPFTFLGEAATCEMQWRHLADWYPDSADLRRYANIVFTEILGQAAYHHRHGDFPGNQRRFAQQMLHVLEDPGAYVLGAPS